MEQIKKRSESEDGGTLEEVVRERVSHGHS